MDNIKQQIENIISPTEWSLNINLDGTKEQLQYLFQSEAIKMLEGLKNEGEPLYTYDYANVIAIPVEHIHTLITKLKEAK